MSAQRPIEMEYKHFKLLARQLAEGDWVTRIQRRDLEGSAEIITSCDLNGAIDSAKAIVDAYYPKTWH